MPAITQDANANSKWTGHLAATDPLISGVTHYRLYAANKDEPKEGARLKVDKDMK